MTMSTSPEPAAAAFDGIADTQLQAELAELEAQAASLRLQVLKLSATLGRVDARKLTVGEELATRKVARDTAPDWAWLLINQAPSFYEGQDVRGRALQAALTAINVGSAGERLLYTQHERNSGTDQSELWLAVRDADEAQSLSALYVLKEILPFIKLGLPSELAHRRNADSFKAVKLIRLGTRLSTSEVLYYLGVDEERGRFEVRAKNYRQSSTLCKAPSLEAALSYCYAHLSDAAILRDGSTERMGVFASPAGEASDPLE
jgi:hypothetical protein